MGGERGFTLVEAVVAMTIFAFVAVLVAALYLHGYRSYIRESDRIEVQENLRFAASVMASRIRQAKNIRVYRADGTESTEGTGIRIEFNNSAAGFRFDAGHGEVEEKYDGAWQPLASNIKSLIFNYDESRQVVTISIVGETGESGPISLSTTVHLRVSQDSR
ncbi:PilW family protein [Desulfofundulus thermocisternus]|uniref:PilW family protein n=1 Tax=Desulfofundulus thermocisternus TaxID=42471 RepID=UPI00217E3780|nr:prepilin-type N-terminal cleavage/methylation domain-containing protein [Desulfofundulus thermocisternus]MCS5694819.1 prepilin-type N-terminal cleavage/methylation domain-containing protein [Desulfofundulus thermocisternus]